MGTFFAIIWISLSEVSLVCVCMWWREDLQYTSLLESLDSSGS